MMMTGNSALNIDTLNPALAAVPAASGPTLLTDDEIDAVSGGVLWGEILGGLGLLAAGVAALFTIPASGPVGGIVGGLGVVGGVAMIAEGATH
jgi:hypothetical protein